MFARSHAVVQPTTASSRCISCSVFTPRPSGGTRGVSLLDAPSPPSDATASDSRAAQTGEPRLLPANTAASTERSRDNFPSYVYLITLLTAFSVIAVDVNADSLHLLQPVDIIVHTTVSANIPFEFRADIADKLISDTPIHTGAAMIVAGLAVIATTRPKQAAALAGLFAVFNFTFGGIGFGKDASATTAVKKFFARARPSSDLHHSFSFPSGHSTSAYFILGFFFFIIVPALASWSAGLPKDTRSDGSPSAAVPAALQNALDAAAMPKAALALTIAGGAVTQSGRLLADVHWVSDVLAGALWGSSGVALACVVYDAARAMVGQGTGKAENNPGAPTGADVDTEERQAAKMR
eukprot:jgi/Ulvmu1/6817/UM031_0021.1